MVVIWNTSKVSKTREVTVMAKAHTDVDISRMKVAAFDDTRYMYYHNLDIHVEMNLLTYSTSWSAWTFMQTVQSSTICGMGSLDLVDTLCT